MNLNNQPITFRPLGTQNQIPYELLLLADPSKDRIDAYLPKSDIYIAAEKEQTVGVILLFPLNNETIEIKSIAVKPAFQGKGIGSYLLKNAIKIATLKKQKSICIGTANSSTGPLYLYQKPGFKITAIKSYFFIKNYPEPIYENGLQAKDMLILTKAL